MRDLNNLKKKILKVINLSKASHIGSIFSCLDIFFCLYQDYIHKNKLNKFILSKGHAGLAYYSVLNYYKKISDKDYSNYYQNGSKLIGHISHKVKGIEVSTGSLGHGLSISSGYALAKKKDRKKGKVFCLLSDGELNEGSNWEAIMFAAHFKLNNLIALIDYNKLQSLDTTYKTLNLEPLKDKFRAFGWRVIVSDGHDHAKIKKTLLLSTQSKIRPTVVIFNTTKGKGIKFMENKVLWHYRIPQNQEYEMALSSLKKVN